MKIPAAAFLFSYGEFHMMELDWTGLSRSFAMLFVIIDPIASLPIFITLTKKSTTEQRRYAANYAASVAGAVLVVFILAGPQLLGIFGISMSSFKIAGGILLGLIGISTVLGFSYGDNSKEIGVGAVLIAVPMLSGPGALTTTLILTNLYGAQLVLLASVMVIVCAWAIFRNAGFFNRVLGTNGMELVSRLMGIIIVAIGVELIKNGILG
jgi:multiple antibiotic resistance protein